MARMVRNECSHAVLEVSSHALEQGRVAGIAFDAACVTNVRRDHLDYHHSLPAYYRAKSRLFDHLTGEGFAVINADDPVARNYLNRIDGPVLTVAMNAEAEITASLVERSTSEQTFLLSAGSDVIPVRTRMIGVHHVYNCLTAAAVGLAYGIDLPTVVRGLEAIDFVPGRLERIECGQPFSVFVDFAHTPDALSAVLTALREVVDGRLICVFGAGGDRDHGKRPLMAGPWKRTPTWRLITDDNPRTEDPQAIIERNPQRPDVAGRGRSHSRPRRGDRLGPFARPEGRLRAVGRQRHETNQIIGQTRSPVRSIAKWLVNGFTPTSATRRSYNHEHTPRSPTSHRRKAPRLGRFAVQTEPSALRSHRHRQPRGPGWRHFFGRCRKIPRRHGVRGRGVRPWRRSVRWSIDLSRPPADRWVLEVDQTLEALHKWAAWKRLRFRGAVVGVTGSVGKTTTRQMIHTVLKTRFHGTASPKNFNNEIGLPLSLLGMGADDDYAVLELGASGPGHIARLAGLCRPTIGVITNIADAHLGGFGSRRKVAEGKAELLDALPLDGHAVLADDGWLRRVAMRCKAPTTWVGRNLMCDVAAADVQWSNGRLGFRVADCAFSIPVWGRHHLGSALLAVAVGRIFGIELEAAAQALENFDSVPMRCQVSEIRGATIINDAYNASPMAMRAALELLRDFDAAGRRIVLVGDMTELGDEAPALHRELGNQVVTLCGADMLIACGQHAGDVVAAARAAGMPQRQAIACRTPQESLPYLGQIILPGDAVLVKGSRALGMEHVVDALKQYPRRRSA